MQRFPLPLFLLSFLLLVAPLAAIAQEESQGVDAPSELALTMSALVAEPDLVLFKAGVFDPVKGVPLDAGFGLSDFRDRSAGNLIYVVQFPCVPGDKERAVLQRQGAEVLHYLPNNAYLVRMDAFALGSLGAAPEVRSAFRLPKFAKVDPALTANPGLDATVELICTPGTTGMPVATRIAKNYPNVEFVTKDYHHQGGRVVCRVSGKDLTAFLDEASGLEDVLSILPWEEKILLNDNSIWVIQNYDTVNKTTYTLSATLWNHGITGTGQIACVNDSGALNTSCFFRYSATAGSEATAQSLTPPATGTVDLAKKTIAYYVEPGAAAYDSSGASYHGTHTCGSVLGDNYATLSTPTSGGHDSGDGMAPNAKLVMQDVGDAAGDLSGLQGDLNNMFLQAYNAGARIHSDSWGTESSNYDATAMDMDEFTYRYEDFLFVVAMGNSGTAPGDGSIGAPATAKDVVSVMATTNGSSSNANNLQSYSRGPVDDGRRKPDVCSPGASITSANGGAACGTQSMSGTSMATPTTAGGLVLLRQYFTDGWYPSGTKTAADARNPSAALMKACLVNGAMEVTGTDPLGTLTRIPSMDQGWGRTHLENALFFSGDTRRTRVWDIRNADGLTTGQQVEYTINVTANTQPLKIHLVWTDPESTTLAATNLVNNMDLEVVSPSATLYRGNVFATGQSTTGGTADILNNVEGFVLNSPATGNWTVRVKATAVPGTGSAPYSNRQGFALVATWATCSSSVTAPTGLTATDNGTTGINLSWNTVSGATGYIVYKAKGASPAAGDYSVLIQQAGTTFTDTKVQGGYTYSFKVRATDNCSESPLSSAASATFTGNCALYPTFGGLTSVTNDTGTVVCDLLLGWSAATSNCPSATGITYNIYRGTTPYFTPGAGNLLAHGVTGTSYRDYSIVGLTTYYYLVRAEDSTTLNGGPNNGGNQDTNTVLLMGTPWASTTTSGTFADNGGDTNAKLALAGSWRVTNQQNHTTGGTYCYHNAKDGNNYPAGECAAATTPAMPLSAGAQLSYWVRYNMEYQWDGVVTEISANGGSSWTILTPTPAYPGDFTTGGGVTSPINACLYSLTQTCFNGPSGNAALTAWTQYSHDLSSYSGQTVLVRWNSSSDGGSEFDGFYLDDIQITNASTNDGCATQDGIVALDAASYMCSGDTIGIQLADFDLRNGGTHTVTIASTLEPGGETVTLTESPAGSGSFSGSITTTAAAPPSPGQLSVANGVTITVTYIDADDGHGGTNVTKTDTATADCAAPVISNVAVTNITTSSARVTWTTNEAANSRVTYGTATPPGTNKDDLANYVTSHTVDLTGLSMCTKYYVSATSADAAGNSATDTNGGTYYSFTTLGMGYALGPDTVEGGVLSWAVSPTTGTNIWHQDLCKAVSGTHSWKCGKSDSPTCTAQYDVSLANYYLTWSANFALGASGHGYHLRFNEWYDTESNTGCTYDPIRTQISTDGGSAWTTLATNCGASGGWLARDYDLAAYTGSTVRIRFYFTSDSSGNGLGWFVDDIEVSKPMSCTAEMNYQSNTFTDACSGTGTGVGNGYVDPGETITAHPTLKNTGSQGATGISATLSTSTPNITITGATATYPDLAVGASGACNAPHFTYSVGTGVACGTVINFTLTITAAAGGGPWTQNFTMTVGQQVGGAVTTVFTESFDGTTFPPTGWTAANVTGTTAAWARVTTSTNPTGITPHSGAAMAEFNSYHATSGNSNRLARTANISIPAGSASASAVLWVYHETSYSGYTDQIQVQTSPDGTTWTSRGTAINRYDGSTGWKQHTVDLAALIGAGNFRIGYLGVSNYGSDTYMDDVSVQYTGTPSCNVAACTPGSVPPGEAAPGNTPATSQGWTNKTAHNWPSTSGATSYKVYRGIQGQLANLLNSGTDSCVKYDGASTNCTVNDDPAGEVGRFYWYLVTASNTGGEGTAGNHTNGAGGPRIVNSTGNCP